MTDVVQPDLVFVSKKREKIITRKNIVEAPDLVVEIISEHTEAIDRNRKKTLYERYQVQEYWIVDPTEKQIEQLRPLSFSVALTRRESSNTIFQLLDFFQDFASVHLPIALGQQFFGGTFNDGTQRL